MNEMIEEERINLLRFRGDEDASQKFRDHRVGEFIPEWLEQFSRSTTENYLSGIRQLEKEGLFDSWLSLGEFSTLRHNDIIDAIKGVKHWSEMTRQSRASCYLSFSAFLNRKTQGFVPRAQPNRDPEFKTFWKPEKSED